MPEGVAVRSPARWNEDTPWLQFMNTMRSLGDQGNSFLTNARRSQVD